eukprot:TRINITY_DN1259_c0_g1_i8.p1 TRINITY_DN1259_c0_g1~~TRINITY_DN1259_c0_g1_i8.p1  ORF type:complete len:178 (+),score=7.04 TRINITY_DN1259_c0_g1_i8:198-731(+)
MIMMIIPYFSTQAPTPLQAPTGRLTGNTPLQAPMGAYVVTKFLNFLQLRSKRKQPESVQFAEFSHYQHHSNSFLDSRPSQQRCQFLVLRNFSIEDFFSHFWCRISAHGSLCGKKIFFQNGWADESQGWAVMWKNTVYIVFIVQQRKKIGQGFLGFYELVNVFFRMDVIYYGNDAING